MAESVCFCLIKFEQFSRTSDINQTAFHKILEKLPKKKKKKKFFEGLRITHLKDYFNHFQSFFFIFYFLCLGFNIPGCFQILKSFWDFKIHEYAARELTQTVFKYPLKMWSFTKVLTFTVQNSSKIFLLSRLSLKTKQH